MSGYRLLSNHSTQKRLHGPAILVRRPVSVPSHISHISDHSPVKTGRSDGLFSSSTTSLLFYDDSEPGSVADFGKLEIAHNDTGGTYAVGQRYLSFSIGFCDFMPTNLPNVRRKRRLCACLHWLSCVSPLKRSLGVMGRKPCLLPYAQQQ
jgi:hypothetical protein